MERGERRRTGAAHELIFGCGSVIDSPPSSYDHKPEAPFEDNLANYFRALYGDDVVEQQVYQSEPRWFCDIVVTLPSHTLFIETESRESEVRSGIMQALGYAAADPVRGVPMVVAPQDHLPDDVRLDRLRQTTTVVIREFDEETGEFLAR